MSLAMEPHFTPGEIASRWGFHRRTVVRMFSGVSGVLKVSGPSGRITLRIPESVAERVHANWANQPALIKGKSRSGRIEETLLAGAEAGVRSLGGHDGAVA